MKRVLLLLPGLILMAACGGSGDAPTAAAPANDTATAGEPDLCFCLQTSSTDPEVIKACEAILPKDLTPAKITSLIVECSNKDQ